MAKTATETVTKSATRAANTKTRKTDKVAATDKPKREPSAYQIFCKENMKKWNEENPGRAKEAMTQIALLWKNAPENPNRGQEAKPRKSKAKEPKVSKAKEPETNARSKKTKKTKKKVEVEEEDEDEDEDAADNSDAAEANDNEE